MFFLSCIKNKSNARIPLITKIVLVILLFWLISDKSSALDISHNVSRLQTINMDYIVNELMMLSRLSFNYSFFIIVGLMGILVGVLFALTYCIMSTYKESSNNECVIGYTYKVENAYNLHTNNIYLLTNKFIC